MSLLGLNSHVLPVQDRTCLFGGHEHSTPRACSAVTNPTLATKPATSILRGSHRHTEIGDDDMTVGGRRDQRSVPLIGKKKRVERL